MESFADFDQATIAAIATPPGAGGIGIIRISGSRAREILLQLFRPARGEVASGRSHQLRYGWIVEPESGRPLDEVMAVYMAAPATYTREDVVEIHGHGGYVVLREILGLILAREGVRAAEAGEFTKRAFLNGRIDLTRAEAVLDVLNAGTREGLNLAMSQLQGGLQQQLEPVRRALLEVLAVVEVAIDFPDEDAEIIDTAALGRRLELEVRQPLQELLERADRGRIFREGATVVILGRPNVGKSSLLNALLQDERAIVTAIPGTTRDTIEECLNIHGMPLRIVDTAGIRETTEEVEGIGIERSRRRVAEADLVLLLVEAGSEPSSEDMALFDSVREKKVLVVVNKLDLLGDASPAAAEAALAAWRHRFPGRELTGISARARVGLEQLEDLVFRLISGDEPRDPGYACVPNARHRAALARTLPALERVQQGLAAGLAPELLAVELQACLGSLGEIIGEVGSEELLDTIFSSFCIGK
ncbi:tRNA modification GTPase TrmE [Desulfurivibrio alkaliphilus AHT 2]|uniref:tRNA modification GTPase MnmE n=2 Tax=Desulfurivibrio alkaliphilus TaxID=427923 RepID=D6Z0W2_DESAT|nr:tRNA modification GTPase TrmE [Desulfurivibrio alkaliphilus AHT 2]